MLDGNTEESTPTDGPDARERELLARGEDRAAAAFAEERQRVVGQVELGADACGERGLGERDREASLGDVVDERAARRDRVERPDQLGLVARGRAGLGGLRARRRAAWYSEPSNESSGSPAR